MFFCVELLLLSVPSRGSCWELPLASVHSILPERRVSILIHIYTHTNTCTYRHIYIYTYIHIHIYTYVHTYIHVSIYTYLMYCTYTYIYIYRASIIPFLSKAVSGWWQYPKYTCWTCVLNSQASPGMTDARLETCK